MTKPTVFCDFDETITTEDMVIAVWREFAPAGWEKVVEDMLARRKGLREGVAEVFSTIPSSRAPQMSEFFLRKVKFRTGLQDLLDFCRGLGIDFVVVSGGVDFLVGPALVPFAPWLKRTHTIPTDLSGQGIRVVYPQSCERCSMCKAAVMDEYPDVYRVLIGDGLTDLHGAEHADFVFGRRRLPGLLAERGLSCIPFENFFDVRDGLATAIRQGTLVSARDAR